MIDPLAVHPALLVLSVEVRGARIGAGGSLTLQTSSVTRNSAFDFYGAAGGGLAIEGQATIKRSLITGNSARFGGGLASGGQVTLTGSTIANKAQ